MQGSSISLLPIEENRRQELLDMFIPYLDEMKATSKGTLELAMNEEFNLLDSYWHDKNRFPYFISRNENEILGFVLVNDYCEKEMRLPRFSVAEFYIKPAYRKEGVGKTAAGLVFRQHKGYWEIRVQDFNDKGLEFWKSCVSIYTDVKIMKSQLTNKLREGTFILFES